MLALTQEGPFKSFQTGSGASHALIRCMDNSQEDLAKDHCSVASSVNQLYYESNQMPSERQTRLTSIRDNTVAFPVLKFIDLFAGIGGIRLALEKNGAECVFSSEWNKFACQTYEKNFGEAPAGDIREISSKQIPDHDLLTAGFPCQPFSISGVSKKGSLGKPHGFDDPTQGTLFFEVKRIIRDKRPRAFLLENVKNLLHHDGGQTFDVILRALEDELDYDIHFAVIDAKGLVPQHRERIYIVGFREPRAFEFPVISDSKPQLKNILDPKPPEKYGLTPHLWSYLRAYAEKHKKLGHGFGFGLADLDGTTRTLSARYYKDGSEILIPRGKGRTPRRLTPRECARLMGFPESFEIPVSDTQAYKQFGNSVVVPVVSLITKRIIECLHQKPISRAKQLSLIATA
jgi:DNA (cytosine-5)-methyltransferase 1